ncbi:MAG: Fpg/Nei family DNA glycosylase [Candidatus Eremiobacteraeota bacterium]|nr:Fpg/Nei family DNA glycosylase [Candidatus Eremiobacteraeota bacterium]
MPEGPQVARYARLQNEALAGKRLRADSPNGRSSDVAAAIDGLKLVRIEAVGKHLLYDFGKERYLHVHLGRFGGFDDGPMPLPEVRGILRFRLYAAQRWFELRGAIAIELFDAAARERLEARIGPNPLDADADPLRAFAKIRASRSPIGMLLMDQSIVGGIGNIYRSEVLFMNRVHPQRRGDTIERKVWRAMWKDLVRVMEHGALVGRIVTTAPEDREKPKGAVRRNDRFYVYRRDGLPCRRCGTIIVTGVMGNRNVFWCPHDQPERPELQATKRSAKAGSGSEHEARLPKTR